MGTGYAQDNMHSKVNEFMSIFRVVLDKLFVQKQHKLNAQIIINELKQKEIDFDKIKSFMDKLPAGEWNLKIFIDNIPSINEIFGISDEDIINYSVTKVNKQGIEHIRWEILVESMLENSKFSNEFYDALKYNGSSELSISQIKLLNELMMVFKLIKDKSKEIYDKFNHKKLTKPALNRLNLERLPIEYLILRILYIFLNLKDADDKKFAYFARLLGTERIALAYQEHTIPKFN